MIVFNSRHILKQSPKLNKGGCGPEIVRNEKNFQKNYSDVVTCKPILALTCDSLLAFKICEILSS